MAVRTGGGEFSEFHERANALQIVGIILIRNEDRFIRQVITNIIRFCDRIIVCDNGSTDDTVSEVKTFLSHHDHISLHHVTDPSISHDLLKPYVGTDTWVFGVDGDELYDPHGLAELKSGLQAGLYDRWWAIFGNVLNCSRLDLITDTAEGYLSPPCRSMTKLYNFNILRSWSGKCPQRLHGGSPVFREGFDATLRYGMHKETTWESSIFRCLHMCFLPRSSKDKIGENEEPARCNISESMQQRWPLRMLHRWLKHPLRSISSYKNEKYRRGPLVSIDTRPFFRP